MNIEAYRELKILEELAANPRLTQRYLAGRLQVALGLTNLMIRRFAKKGYVKIVSVHGNQLRYLLTPTGLVEKTRLTYEFLEYSLHLYREVRRILIDTLSRVVASGGRRVVLFGASEIAEMTYLTVKELGLELVAVIDDEQSVGRSFLGLPITSFAQVPTLSFDCGIISALNGGLDTTRQRLATLGVPESKIIVIEHQGPQVRLIPLNSRQQALGKGTETPTPVHKTIQRLNAPKIKHEHDGACSKSEH